MSEECLRKEKFELTCGRLRKQVDKVEEKKAEEEEEEDFPRESSRLQGMLNAIHQNINCPEKLPEVIQKAGIALVAKWLCTIKKKNSSTDFMDATSLSVKREKDK